MPPLNCPAPDPETPEGLAFIFGAGMVDPRVGKTLDDRQPCMIIQSWVPTAKLYWELGVRFHPELATKWLKGGGQFQCAEIVNEPPEDFTLEMGVDQILEVIGREKPEFVDTIKRIRDTGTPEQKQAAVKKFEGDIKNLVKMAKFVEGHTE